MAVCSVSVFPCKNYTYFTDTEGVCLNLKWTVKNFLRLPIFQNYPFPPIRPTPECDLRVSFCKGNGTLSLFISVIKLKSVIYFDATTIICEENGKQLHQETLKYKVLNEKYNILPGLKSRDNLPDSLVIEIKLELYNLSSEKCDTESLGRENEIKLAEDMKKFILAEHPEEIVLKSKDGDEIPANRAILRARSPVFQIMFDHPMSEQETKIVLIDDVRGTTLDNLVDFLYSGKAELPENELQSMKEMYYAADKYQVLDLRKLCAEIMVNMLKEENAIELLLLAHRHSDQDLKHKCLNFIRTCIDTLMGTEGWMNLKMSDPGLVIEVLENCCKGSAALQRKSE